MPATYTENKLSMRGTNSLQVHPILIHFSFNQGKPWHFNLAGQLSAPAFFEKLTGT